MIVKRVLPIRLSSKYRAKVRSFVYDLAQFQNLLWRGDGIFRKESK